MPRPRRTATHARSRGAAPVAAGVLVLLAALALAPTAMAGKPTGEYAAFNDCPLGTSGVDECVYATFSGGELVLGKMDVPIDLTITLQGGLIVTEKEETFVNTTEGQTLSKTPNAVPGGFEGSAVTLTMELAGAVALSRSNLAGGKGTALKLPVKMHLKSEFFGEECFLGTGASPVTLNLTTGSTSPPEPNKPIKGTAGEHESKEAGNLVIYRNDALVENAFSVPAAKGCGGIEEKLIDALVNEKYQLPAAAGHNTAVLKGTSEFASAEAVRKSE